MLAPGNLLYFNQFYFRSGNPAKPKYLIVLGSIDNNIIIHSLPTRTDSVPSTWPKTHGCNEKSEDNLSFYYFEKGKIITEENDFSFDFDTYVLGENVTSESLEYFEDFYDLSNDCQLIGKLTQEEFNNIVECFTKSCMVKNKFKKALSKKATS